MIHVLPADMKELHQEPAQGVEKKLRTIREVIMIETIKILYHTHIVKADFPCMQMWAEWT
eukprot:1433999-Amphidinium_carterae.1